VTSIQPHRAGSSNADPLAHVARRALERDARGREIPEPSLGARLGQIGVLGWTIIIPMLLALFAGRWLDRTLQTNVFFSGSLLMVGAAIGFWSAWRWMHARGP
jgi:ATP synthase protein I